MLNNKIKKLFLSRGALAVLGIFLVLAPILVPFQIQTNTASRQVSIITSKVFADPPTDAGTPQASANPSDLGFTAPTPSGSAAGIANSALGGASEIGALTGGGSPATAPAVAAAAAAAASPPLCANASSCIGVIVYVFTVPLMSVFAYVGDWVFSLAVQLSLNSTTYALSFLTSSWAVVRDLANMAFIFILVYLAVTVMFSAETANTMRILATTIIMAILINFSFFITRVVIDTGNILAIQFYNAIQVPNNATLGSTSGTPPGTPGSTIGNAVPTAANYITGTNGANAKDLSATIMQSLGAQNLLGTVSLAITTQPGSSVAQFAQNLITIIIIYLSTAAIFAMLAFAFLTVGFKFIMRIVGLWFIIIAAPAAFAIRSIIYVKNDHPKQWWNQWRDGLIQFSFYPAIFLFMFLLMNVVMRALGQCPTGVTPGFNTSNGTGCGLIPNIFAGATANAANASAGSTPALITIGSAIANVGLRLGIVLIMLYYGLKAADMIVKTGTGAAASASNWVGRRLGGMTYGLAARGLQRTAGLGGNRLAENAKVRKWAADEKSGFNRLVGKNLIRGGNTLARSSFDLRGLPGVRSGVLGLGGIQGGDIGAPLARSYQTNFDARVKAQKEFADKLKPTDLQLKDAFAIALNNLESDDDRKKLREAAAHYAEQQESLKEGRGATQNDVKEARKYYESVAKDTKFNEKLGDAKKEIGADFNKNYGKMLMGRNGKVDRTAGLQIADFKSDQLRIKDLISDARTSDKQAESLESNMNVWRNREARLTKERDEARKKNDDDNDPPGGGGPRGGGGRRTELVDGHIKTPGGIYMRPSDTVGSTSRSQAEALDLNSINEGLKKWAAGVEKSQEARSISQPFTETHAPLATISSIPDAPIHTLTQPTESTQTQVIGAQPAASRVTSQKTTKSTSENALIAELRAKDERADKRETNGILKAILGVLKQQGPVSHGTINQASRINEQATRAAQQQENEIPLPANDNREEDEKKAA
jgi:hypothetical protein